MTQWRLWGFFKAQRRTDAGRRVARPALQGWMTKRGGGLRIINCLQMQWNEDGGWEGNGRTRQKRLWCHSGNWYGEFYEWRQKVPWIQERTKIETVTGRVITQQDRPCAHKSHQTHYCLLLLLSFCPSASSLFPTLVISPASVGALFSCFLIFHCSLIFHVSPRKPLWPDFCIYSNICVFVYPETWIKQYFLKVFSISFFFPV